MPAPGVPYRHVRTYRSRIDFDGVLGFGWDHSYNRYLRSDTTLAGCKDLLLANGDGTVIRFVFVTLGANNSVVYRSPDGFPGTLTGTSTGNVRELKYFDGTIALFDDRGLMTDLRDGNGVGLRFSWQVDPFRPARWRLSTVADVMGRTISYAYNGPFLESVNESSTGVGAFYSYLDRDLDAATDWTGQSESYKYDNSAPVALSPAEAQSIPDGLLRESCGVACAPIDPLAGSSCHAGGACPSPSALCTSQFGACRQACQAQCPDACRRGCSAGCASACSDACISAAPQLAADCHEFLPEYCGLSCHGAIDKTCSDACSICEFTCFVDSDCRSACGICLSSGVFCPDSPGTQTCGYDCQDDCASVLEIGRSKTNRKGPDGVCHVVFEPTETPTCADVARTACSFACWGGESSMTNNPRPGSCMSRCLNGEADDPGCGDSCATSCFGSCAPILETCTGAAGQCQNDCRRACVAQQRTAQGGDRFGYERDLNHNLVSVYWGHYAAGGELKLSNTYGLDPARADFDAVIVQSFDVDRVMTYSYQQLPDGDQERLAAFEPVNICPRDASGNFGPPAVRGDHSSLRGPLPATRTDVTDVYGAPWTFFFDDRGQLLREVNNQTGSVTSYNWLNGFESGRETPLRGRVCYARGQFGNVLTSTTLPQPGRFAATAAITQSFKYQFIPGYVRLAGVSDSRPGFPDAISLVWDSHGNLVSESHPNGDSRTFVPHHQMGLPEWETDASGVRTRREYQR